MSNKKVKIYVTTHKYYNIVSNDVYIPLFVGSNDKESFNYLRDDVGDNISKKNSYYSELTGMYWVWKNSDADIVGLNHYRRILVNGFLGCGDLLTKDDIEMSLKENDVIVYKKKKLGRSVYNNFRVYVSKEDLDISCKVFEKVHPDYKETFYQILNGKEMYSYSIFVSSKEWFDNYSSWLFSYLFELEEEIYKFNQFEHKRVLGYIAEILLMVYIKHNNFKVKEYYLRFIESNSNFLANLINDSNILGYIYYEIFLNQKKLK